MVGEGKDRWTLVEEVFPSLGMLLTGMRKTTKKVNERWKQEMY